MKTLMTRIGRYGALATIAIACLVGAAAAKDDTKLERQIKVMARVIDAVLVESPNWLVQGREVTEGFEDEGTGVFFTFQASLTGFGYHAGSNWSFWPFIGKSRIHITEIGDDDSDRDGDEEIRIRDGEIQIRKKGGKWTEVDEKEVQARQQEKYEDGKEELIECLMDFGDVLRALPAGQSVRIVARIRDVDFPKGNDVDKLTLRVGIDDLRAYADGRLSASELRSRIDIRES